jgi:outer membrane protein assembly factor BamA
VYSPKDATDAAHHSVLGAGGMYAEGGSWAALVGHRAYWSRDRYRSTIGGATGHVFYDLDLKLANSTNTISIGQDFDAITLAGAMRIGKSSWLGIGVVYGKTTVHIEQISPPPIASIDPDATIDLSNLMLTGERDTRDNDMYPRRGYTVNLRATISREAWGSNSDYEILQLDYNGYRSLAQHHVLAWRAHTKIVGDDAPFFAMAWFGSGCDLRGYTPGSYIGKSLFTAQAEWRWQMLPRWGVVAFGGAGSITGTIDEKNTETWLPAAGAGLRFRLVKSLDLNLRADVAWGRDDHTFTLSVGEAF